MPFTWPIPDDLFYVQLGWIGERLDPYCQYYTVPGATEEFFWSTKIAIMEARKKGFYRSTRQLHWAEGTIVGVQTWHRRASLLGSIQPLLAPAVRQSSRHVAVGWTFLPDTLVDLGITQMCFLLVVQPLWIRLVVVDIVPTPTPAEIISGNLVEITGRPNYYIHVEIRKDIKSPFESPPYKWPGPPAGIQPLAKLHVTASFTEGEDAPEIEMPTLYHLYHETKIGAEISPADGTALWPGQLVTIDAWPTNGRTLTLFTVNKDGEPAEEKLPDALISNYTDLDAEGITPGETYMDGQARDVHGPVTADVYVSAIADAIEIEGELDPSDPSGLTIQMTTTDCLVESGSWELGDTNLPASVSYSISVDGLITLTMSENIWDGIQGGEYYIFVTFNGYTDTQTIKLIITIPPLPAYGTVWTPIAPTSGLTQDVNDILLAQDGTLYFLGEDKIWTSTDLAEFTEVPLSGTVDTEFGVLGEASDGRIVAMDKTRLWLKDTGSDTFVRQTTGPIPLSGKSYYVTADPASSSVFITDDYGSVGRIREWDLDTSTEVDYYDVVTGLNGWVRTKGVRADDGSWVFIGGKTGGYAVSRINEGVETQVIPNTSAYGNNQGCIYKEPDGRIYMLTSKDATNAVFRYSDDNGVTWTDEALTPCSGATRAATYLKPDYAVFASLDDVRRTDDAFVTNTNVQTLDGTTISSFCRLENFKILCGTNGTTTNLYISEA